MNFIKWMGTQSKLVNGQVIGWFLFGCLVGMIAGTIIAIH